MILLTVKLVNCKGPSNRMEKSSYASASSGELAVPASGVGRPVRVIPLRQPLEAAARGPASFSPSLWSSAMERARGMGPREWAEAALPCLAWMRSYPWKEDFQADLAAGVTVGVMLVPQVPLLSSFEDFVLLCRDRLFNEIMT